MWCYLQSGDIFIYNKFIPDDQKEIQTDVTKWTYHVIVLQKCPKYDTKEIFDSEFKWKGKA